ncbi:MAG: tRNA pseudouridine(55) synthase TruB [Cyclobacteriaceae bacterium]|nr:tRNA pseudouridine(55) synthase TruB [Cyclobacteriaceae bacterium]
MSETPLKVDEAKVLLVNKPYQWTSFDVVKKLRYALKVKKIGHAGTLDPLATGLLILCTGKMTKQIENFQAQEKEYTGTFVLGKTTPSFDLETEIDSEKDIEHLTEEKIKSVTTQFSGWIDQIPPVFSAVKVNGKRAYKSARKGDHVEIKSRKVEIKEFEITRINLPEIDFRIVCSKGTYIRSIARDVGVFLEVGAYLSALCRTRIGEFKLENASTIDEIVSLQ